MNLRRETLLLPTGYRSLITSVINEKLNSHRAGYGWPSLYKQEENEMRFLMNELELLFETKLILMLLICVLT